MEVAGEKQERSQLNVDQRLLPRPNPPPQLPPYWSHPTTNNNRGGRTFQDRDLHLGLLSFYHFLSSCYFQLPDVCQGFEQNIYIWLSGFSPSTILLFGSGRGGQEIPSHVSSTGFEIIYLFASPTSTGFEGARLMLWPDLPS